MDQVRKFLKKFYLGVGTTQGQRLARAADLGQWEILQKESLSDVATYQSPYAFFKATLCADIARKLLLPGDNGRRKAAAVQTFWASEAQCCQTNAYLRRFVNQQGPFTDFDNRVYSFIMSWQKILTKRLGPAPKWYSLTPRFSGGSTLSDKGKLITIPDKMSSKPTAYAGLLDGAYDSTRNTPLEGIACVVRSNKFFTVPKDSTKDRGCCVEASIAVSLQLDVGRHLKTRYKKAYGVDLRHAQPLHRRLARDASAGLRDLVTVDLSNASDTVARELIRVLMPSDWWVLLNSLRAHSTMIDGKTVYLEKFSSMGNGFTFELETWIFRTLLETLGADEAYVYGDDIICPTALSRTLLSALALFGFTPNKKKTFVEGPFRESCGGDFFKGVPVRAHFLKEIPDEPQKWIGLANGLRRVDPELSLLSAAWWFCVDQLPTDWRNFGPSSCGDGLLHVPDAMRHARVHRFRTKVGGAVTYNDLPAYRAKAPISRKYGLGSYWEPRVAMIAGSLGVPAEVATRDDITGYKTVHIPVWGVDDVHAGFCTFA